MVHFRNRTDLILWLDKSSVSAAVKRALWTGSIELLGGFSRIPPSDYPGWIFKLISRRGKEYLIAIICDTDKKCHRKMELESVPWDLWDGKLGRKTIYEGDRPEKYMELKNGLH